MSSLGAAFPGSANSDLLDATPSDDTGRRSLLEEIKRRGRFAVQSSNYREAEALYHKGIDVSEELAVIDNADDPAATHPLLAERAILYSNRSLARFQMGRLAGSGADARQAVECDSTYVKAHWRLGQACFAQQQYSEALESYTLAKTLDPSNKAVAKEIVKTQKKVDEEQKLLDEACNMSLDEKKTDTASTTTNSPAAAATAPTTRPAKKTKPATTTSTVVRDEDVEFTKSEIAKGYKIVAGKKTSYFHNELTDEARQLIGDIAPKKLDASSHSAAATDASTNGASAWNKAGTWEEKNVTQWATKSLVDVLKATVFTIPDMGDATVAGQEISVTAVPTCEGHASVATVRGKKRYIYEFSIVVEWVVEIDCNECKGSLAFPDVDGTCDGVYDMTDYKVNSKTPGAAKHVLERFVKNGGLRDSLTSSLNEWVELFQSTY